MFVSDEKRASRASERAWRDFVGVLFLVPQCLRGKISHLSDAV